MESRSVTVTSFGPAGIPHNVQESGANILNNFCNAYPDTDISCLIPEFFGDNITELVEPRENLTRKQEEVVRGRAINQAGEGHEFAVFNKFVRLTRQTDVSPAILVMRTFEMDTKNQMNLKRNVVWSLLPDINFRSVNTAAENDFVILVKDLGIVFVEVKGSTKDSMVRSAEKQLTNVNGIVQTILKATTKDRKRIMPTVKLIIVPDCADETPTNSTPLGSFFIFKDMFEKFHEKWKDVIMKLDQLKFHNPFTPAEFRELSQILVGIWSAKVVSTPGSRTHELIQEAADFSLVKQLKKIDEIVETGNVRNEDQFKLREDKLNPLTKIERTNEADIFRSCSDLKLCYLTPDQKRIFTNYKQVLIRSCAGCRKSLLVLFKALELLSDPSFSSSVLLLAPVPHNIRIRNALDSNHISVELIDQFPPPASSSSVFVMDLDKFFKVDRSTLMGYDLNGYHILIDDLQNLNYFGDDEDWEGDVEIENELDTTFFHVRDFVEKTFSISVQNKTLFWITLDVMQGILDVFSSQEGKSSEGLFFTPDGQQQPLSIPTEKLSHVMRNTHNIMLINNEVREAYMSAMPLSSLDLPSAQIGHKVSSCVPPYHKLQHGADLRLALPFILFRLREELEAVTKPPISLPLSNVAIIFDDPNDLEEYKNDIVSFLGKEFDTFPQSIEYQLASKNTPDIILDNKEHMMSFEIPVVVFICSYGGYDLHYKIGTRARVILKIVDVNTVNPPSAFKNMDNVLWKQDTDGRFIKYTCICKGVHSCTC